MLLLLGTLENIWLFLILTYGHSVNVFKALPRVLIISFNFCGSNLSRMLRAVLSEVSWRQGGAGFQVVSMIAFYSDYLVRMPWPILPKKPKAYRLIDNPKWYWGLLGLYFYPIEATEPVILCHFKTSSTFSLVCVNAHYLGWVGLGWVQFDQIGGFIGLRTIF